MSRILRPFLTRRTFLRGLGGVSLGLPLFHSLGCDTSVPPSQRLRTAQQAAGFPKRLLIIYTPNGNYELPGSMDFTGTNWEPLTPFKDKLLVVGGLDLSVHNMGPGEPHQQGMAWLTGKPLNPGNQVGGCGMLTSGWASGISVDQHIAAQIGQGTSKPSLHFGVQSTAYGGTEVRTVMSYAGSDLPIANEVSPYSMFDVVFSQLGADPVGVAKLRARRHSVLDVVDKQYDALAPKLSGDDKKKLELHLDAIRQVEKGLDNPGGVIGGYCQLPDVGNPIDLGDPNNYPAIGKLQMDLLTMAFACDLTRVATLQWSASTNNRPYPWLMYDAGAGPQPIVDDEHILGHQPDTDTIAWGKLAVIRKWYLEQFAYLLGKLDSIQEGTGTMLDNTVVVLGSEISRGNTHSHMDAPFLIAGGGGYFKVGQYVNYATGETPGEPGVPHNNLLVAIMNAMGVEGTTFGDPAFCTTPLTEILL